MSTLPTRITVRVIANDGKFLGDDIGGAHITVRDALTRAILAEGRTHGGSGNNGAGGVMCAALKRNQPVPTANASAFETTLQLDAPRRIEVTAFGPLGALGSANTTTATQWVYPGKHLTGGDGLLLELHGLIVQVIDPVTHYAPAVIPSSFAIRANVAMMCGCPISVKPANAICPGDPTTQPWLPTEFEVAASIVHVPPTGDPRTFAPIPLVYNPSFGTAGQFTGTFGAPTSPTPLPPGSYQLTVYAYQAATGNTGLDTAVVFLNP